MLTLYDDPVSGNGYKVRLLLAQLGVAYELVSVDIANGDTRTPEFLARNPNGRIPLLRLDDGSYLAESNAIQFYLAEGSVLLPEDREGRARVLQWMFFEQYSHEPYVAVLRAWHHFGLAAERAAEIPEKLERGHQALAIMEGHLAARRFFVDERYTIADIALFAYSHVADEGGFDLARYPAVGTWIQRVAEQPGFVPMAPTA